MSIQDTINTYKIWSPEARHNPQALYAQMRREAPVYRAIGPVSGNTFWFFTRYDDCVAALRDNRFGKVFTRSRTPEQLAQLPPPNALLATIDTHMLNLDPPDHTRLRGLVHKAFTPTMIENLRTRTGDIADALLNDIAASGAETMNLVDDFAFPLPITVIAELLGIPAADRAQFREWTKTIIFTPTLDVRIAAGMQLISYLQPIFAARRRDPKDDLISALVAVEEAGDKMDQNELISMVFLLLAAGHETTVNLITNGMLALLEHPDEMAKLQADFGLMKTAVEEMLRYNGPVETTLSRWAYDDIEWGGQIIQRGDMIMAALLAANRDPDVFPDPDRFDIARTPNKHIAFGGGIHYCIGAPLARLEGTVAIEALLRRFPNMALDVPRESLVWNDQIIFRGLSALPIRLRGRN
ncbi:MAG: cytochrome P450 [Chloroflexota bacterium]|nr:cytochrome P450 [Chloroflexota bacterium]